MKAITKVIVTTLIVLVTLSALSLLTGSVNAAGNLSCQASISAKDSSVDATTSYTFSINNVGEANVGATNITIPSGYRYNNDYSNVKIGKTTTNPKRTAVKVITRNARLICSGEISWASPKM